MAGARPIWNGAISFGLVNIPVSLYSATSEIGLDFDWLDKRTMDPVGYKRINKKTGEEMQPDNIVRGLAYEKNHYVILTDEEIRQALPKSTQTIEIEGFVSIAEISPVYFERPYYLAPLGRSDKAYALLRDTLIQSGKLGIARLVIHTKQHLAALVPEGSALVLILLRWAAQIRSWNELSLPLNTNLATGLSDRELSMAQQLVDSMTMPWDPDRFHDLFSQKVKELVDIKMKEGQTQTVTPIEEAPKDISQGTVIDFTDLLRRSLNRSKEERTEGRNGRVKKASKR